MNRLTKNTEDSPIQATKRNVRAATAVAERAVKELGEWILKHPMKSSQVIGYYSAPVVAPYFAGSMMAAAGVGQLAPLATILASSFARFRMRQITAGTFYALLQSAGLGSVAAQAVSTVGFLSLSGIGENGQKAQEWLISTAYTVGGFQAPIVGLGVWTLGTLMGSIGMLPTVYLAGGAVSSIRMLSFIALWTELRSFAMFSALRWAKDRVFEEFQNCISPLTMLVDWCNNARGPAAALLKRCSLPINILVSNWQHLVDVAKYTEKQIVQKRTEKMKREQDGLHEWELTDLDDEDDISILSLPPDTPSPPARFCHRSEPAPLLVQEDDEEESVFIDWDHVFQGGLAAQGAFPEIFSEVSYFIDGDSDFDNDSIRLFCDDEDVDNSRSTHSISNDADLLHELHDNYEVWASA